MALYKIADVFVSMSPKFETLTKQSEIYKVNDCIHNPDIQITLTDEVIEAFQLKNPHLSLDICEYLLVGIEFYEKLLRYDGMVLHASAVSFKDKAYLFSAPCGTGKSTHTKLWRDYFGEDNVKIINDDKPAIRLIDGEPLVYGTPFSGKTDLNLNMSSKLGGICFLKQGKENKIRILSTEESIFNLLGQTLRKVSPKRMDKLMEILENILSKITVYEMECTISKEAVMLAVENMVKNNNEK
jgi:hypothetical protein